MMRRRGQYSRLEDEEVDLECLWEKAAELGRRVPGVKEGGWILMGGEKAVKEYF